MIKQSLRAGRDSTAIPLIETMRTLPAVVLAGTPRWRREGTVVASGSAINYASGVPA